MNRPTKRTVLSIASIGLFCTFSASISQAAEGGYTISAWPQDIDKVPCDAWKKIADNNWLQVKPIMVSGNYIYDNKLSGAEAKMIDQKCGAK